MSDKLATPLWGDLEDVYEPREDSFFLLDTLENELSCILSTKPNFIVEVGSGSGIIISALAGALKPSVSCLAIDINPKACNATVNTALLNNVKCQIDVVRGDLLSMIVGRNQIDLLVFNPPYVVTPDDEITGDIERSWAGGINGRQVLNRLLNQLDGILSHNGLGYFVLIEENLPDDVIKELKLIGLSAKIISKKKIPGEKLCILKFYWDHNITS